MQTAIIVLIKELEKIDIWIQLRLKCYLITLQAMALKI